MARSGMLFYTMSEISRFFGIIIAMYNREHGIPHFHARYGEYRAVFSIDDLQMIEGSLPKRVISLVLEWAFQHRTELKANWECASKLELPKKINPLE
jgi:hypothetical protein